MVLCPFRYPALSCSSESPEAPASPSAGVSKKKAGLFGSLFAGGNAKATAKAKAKAKAKEGDEVLGQGVAGISVAG